MGRELQSILLVLYRNGVRGSSLLRYMITRISAYKRSYDIVLLRKELQKRLGKVATRQPRKFVKRRAWGCVAATKGLTFKRVRPNEDMLGIAIGSASYATGFGGVSVGAYNTTAAGNYFITPALHQYYSLTGVAISGACPYPNPSTHM